MADESIDVTVNDSYIELHTGPGRGYPIFHVVEQGESIQLLKRRTDWVKVQTVRGKSGWVRRADISKTLDALGNPVNFSEPSRGDFNGRRWEGGISMGDYAGADALTLHGGFRFARNLSTELRLSQATGHFSDVKVGSISLLHHPFPEWRFSPYFMLGAGIIQTSPNATLVQTQDRQDTALLVGLGGYYYLNRRFVLRAEYNNHLILTSRNENEEVHEWKLGFNVFF